MGSNHSRSRKESNKGPGSKRKKNFLHSSNRSACYLPRRTPPAYDPDEQDHYCSLPRDFEYPPSSNCVEESGVAYPELMTCEYKKYDKRNSLLQRVLPLVPSSLCIDESEQIHESDAKLPHIDELESSSDRAAEPSCGPTQNSYGRTGDKESEVLIEGKDEPSDKLCQSIESLYGNEATVGPNLQSEEPTPQEQNNLQWKSAAVPDDGQTIANPDLTMEKMDSTYLPLNSSEMFPLDQSIDTYRCITRTDRSDVGLSSEYNESCCTLEAMPENIESENSGSYQVPTQRKYINDYVRTDFNLNNDVLVGTDTYTTTKHPRRTKALFRTKTQAIVGPSLEHRVQGGVVLYPVQAGTKRTLSGATIEVPATLSRDLRLGCIEVGWSSSAAEFPILAQGQHPITKVLHCLPHGSTFTSPVVISVNLPMIVGQIEIYYSPTDVGQAPVWTKLKVVDAPENTRFTDDRNVVTLDRDRSAARFELHHFCSFFMVENDRLVETRKTKATLLLKNEFMPNCCNVIVRVVLGCLEDVAQQKMMEKLRDYKSTGFRVLDDVEFDLVENELKSTVSVKISQIQWMPEGDITHGNLDTEEFGLHRLWNQGTVGVMFWQRSQMTNGVKPKSFAATIHIQQDDRQDMRTKIFCSLECPSPPKEEQQTMPVNDYTLIQRCDKLAKDFPSFMPSGAVPPRSSCSCWSDYKSDVVDLHSNSSEPEPKAAAPAENFDHQQKDIEVRKAIRL